MPGCQWPRSLRRTVCLWRSQLDASTLDGMRASLTEPQLDAILARPARDAVYDAMAHWMPRSSAALPRFGLTQTEYRASLCLLYLDDVRSDGHRGFFLRNAGRHISDLVEALEACGAGAARRILVDACAVFPKAAVPVGHGDVELFFEDCFRDVLDLLAQLDRRLSALPVCESVLGMLIARRFDILRPERGLP